MTENKEPLVCIREETLQEHSMKITELQTEVHFKKEKIDKIIEDQQRMEDKIDKLTEAVSELQLQSLKDDKDIDKRLTSVETTVRVLKWIVTLLFGSGVMWVILSFVRG